MKNAAIFTFVRYSENSMVASIRIARWLENKMQVKVYDQTNIQEIEGKRLDLLVIVNGAYGFCKCLPELAKLVLTSKRIVWVQNDFTIIPPKIESEGVSPFRAAFRERHEDGKPHMDFWTTCDDWKDKTPASRYVNWNALTFDESYSPKVIAARRKKAKDLNLLYYGSYRNGSGKSSRVRYFDRYFKDPKVRTVISSPAKQFAENYPLCSHDPAIMDNFYDTIGQYGLGLYLEDRMSHERFHSPANRFYEMLSAGLPMVFQPEAEAMMARAGYDITPYIVHSAKTIANLMDFREDIGRQQRKMWVDGNESKFRTIMEGQFSNALLKQKEMLQ